MKGIVLKITLSVCALILIAVVGMTYFSSRNTTRLFREYMINSIEVKDPYPLIKRKHLVLGPSEKRFIGKTHIEFLWIGVPTIILAFILSYIIARRLAAPMKKLNSWAREISKGNLGSMANIPADDELHDLVVCFEQMAEELNRAQILRKQFFADAAHELKTPIAVIRGNLEGMIDGVIPANKEMLGSLLEETDYLTMIINDIKYLALADSGHVTLNRGEANINDIVRTCVTGPRAAAKSSGIEVSFDPAADPITAAVDSERLTQVIYNLLVNAEKYSPAGGKIVVRTESIVSDGAPSFKITVEDSGVGISAEDLPYIFERFYRTDKSRNRKTGGFGLGLSIVKKIVELHGGHVGVESELNKGSTFSVLIPIE